VLSSKRLGLTGEEKEACKNCMCGGQNMGKESRCCCEGGGGSFRRYDEKKKSGEKIKKENELEHPSVKLAKYWRRENMGVQDKCANY